MSAKVKNAEYTKQYNRLHILRLLRQSALSRADLARQTGLTRAAISLITEELIAEGMVQETSLMDVNHARGRMPVLLQPCADAAYAVGIRLTRKDCTLGIANFSGEPLLQKQLPLAKSQSELLTLLVKETEAMIHEAGIPREKLLGVGIAAPGPVDTSAGRILNPPDFDAFHQFDIAEGLMPLLQLPVYLENDANASALYHYMDGNFAGKENFLLLIVDSGVGSGVISRGHLLRSGGFACELGHTSIDFQGPKCACGNQGCLEVYASTHRILAKFPGYESWETLMASPHAKEALALEAKYLAAAIVNFTNLIRIDAVVLAGQLQEQVSFLAPLLTEQIRGRSLSLGREELQILPALKQPGGAVREASSIVFGRYLDVR